MLNLEHFRSISLGDKTLEVKLISLFKDTEKKCLGNIKAAMAAKDAQKWKAATHEFKGASASIGADMLYEACLAAEKCENDRSLWQEMLENIEKEVVAVHIFIEKNLS